MIFNYFKKSIDHKSAAEEANYSITIRKVAAVIFLIATINNRFILKADIEIIPYFLCCFFEFFINQPYPFILKKFKDHRNLIFINALIDALVITIGIHYAGGQTALLHIITYPLLFIYSAMFLKTWMTYAIANYTCVLYFSMLLLETKNIIPTINVFNTQFHVYSEKTLFIMFSMSLPVFNLLAYFLSFTSNKIRQREEEIHKEKQRFEGVVSHANEWVWEINLEGFFTYSSSVVLDMLGYSKEEILKKTFYNIFEKQIDECRQITKNNFNNSNAFKNFQTWCVTKPGYKIFLESIAVPTYDEKGDIRSYVGISRDVTQQKQLEISFKEAKEKAEELTKSKSSFISNMSHEIRTPLNAILGFSQLLSKTELNLTQKSYIDTISKSGELLLTIINDILDFSKIEANKIVLEKIDFNLEYLIYDVLNMFTPRIDENNIDTYIDIDKNVHRNIKGDPTRLRQILINLINNSVKFTSKGDIGIIVRSVSDSIDKSIIEITVKDTGIGIKKEKIHLIFDSFTQADASTTRKFGGTGLGLAICKALIESMGGKISVESAEGIGSEFTFSILFEKGQAMGDTEIFPFSVEQLKNIKIFIIDDNKKIQELLTEYCNQLSLNILAVASNGPEALKFMEEFREKNNLPDIILCDVIMPQMNGYQLVKKIKDDSRYDSAKIIICTSDIKIGDVQLAQEKKLCDGYIPKPINFNELKRVIVTMLGDKRKEKTIITRHLAKEMALKGLKILVVEDKQENQNLMKVLLGSFGCNYDCAFDGQEAINKMKKNKYDVCLMDIQMAVLDGIKAAKIIREEISKDLPIIAVSAGVQQEEVARYYEAGMNDFIPKPIDINLLRDKILEQVEKK